jgi:DNA-binding beta-propeller fold protein YncE
MRKLIVLVVATAFATGTAVAIGAAPRSAGAEPATCAVTSVVEHCEAWSDRAGVPVDGQNAAVAIAETPDGSRVVTAGYGMSTPTASAHDFLVGATNTATGAHLWTSSYDGPSAGEDQATALAMSPDGTKVFVTGASEHAPGNSDYATVAYDLATGARLWAARYNGPFDSVDYPTAITASPDGSKVYVTGYSQLGLDAATGLQVYAATTVAYATTSGAQQWLATYQGPAHLWDIPTGLAASGGRVYITARSNGGSPTTTNDTDDATVAYDGATGSQLWASRYDSGTRDYPHGLAATPDGSRVYVTGERDWSGFGGADVVTLGYDAASGALNWSSVYASPSGNNEVGLSVAVSPTTDRVFVTGFGNDDGTPVDRSAITIAYSGDGQQLWLSRHTNPGGEAMGKAVVSPDGQRVYVTGVAVGQSIGGGAGLLGIHYVDAQAPVTVAYDTRSGAVAWSAHFADQGQGRDAVVSPDSARVYVAVGGSDAAAVAYDR